MGVSVPTRLEMEEFYRFIRNPAKRLYSVSFLRITSWASPSLQGLEWKYLTDLYAILRRDSIEFHFCVQFWGCLRPHEARNGRILQIYTQSREETLLNFTFAYNFKSISVPAIFKMEITYKFIRRSAEKCCRIAGLRIILRGVSVPARLEMEISYRFIRNPAKWLHRISLLRIILRVSPSPQRFLYAVIKFALLTSLVCV